MKNKIAKKHRFLKVMAALILLCAAIIADSNLRLTVSQYTSESARLPEAFDGFRIVQLSDLHGAEFGTDNARLIQAVAAEEPDLIALTGDFIMSAQELSVTETLVRALTEIAPTYFVSGNHDWASGEIQALEEILERWGVTFLHNEYRVLERDGQTMILAGVEDPNSWAEMLQPEGLVAQIRAEYPDSYVVLLGHRNYWLERYPDLDVDIIFCGHGHGGVVRLPLIGGLFSTEHTLLPAYTKGLYAGKRYDMVVSAGLGSSGPVPRFLNNPQLVSVTLTRSTGAD